MLLSGHQLVYVVICYLVRVAIDQVFVKSSIQRHARLVVICTFYHSVICLRATVSTTPVTTRHNYRSCRAWWHSCYIRVFIGIMLYKEPHGLVPSASLSAAVAVLSSTHNGWQQCNHHHYHHHHHASGFLHFHPSEAWSSLAQDNHTKAKAAEFVLL